MREPRGSSNPQVFINCPFDRSYEPLFYAILFATKACGCSPRCALETIGVDQERFSRIAGLIRVCPIGIHDLSRLTSSEIAGRTYPRFNMPFELGLFFGAQLFGTKPQRKKRVLLLESESFDSQKAISDLAGRDAVAHANDPELALSRVRAFLANVDDVREHRALPGTVFLRERFDAFRRTLADSRLTIDDYGDVLTLIDDYLAHP